VDTDNTNKILIIDDSVNDAENTASQIRNAGLTVRLFTVESEDELTELIKSEPLDLILCATQSIDPEIESLLQIAKQSGKDIPIIALGEHFEESAATKHLLAGCNNYSTKSNQQHLGLIVKNELENLRLRRDLRKGEGVVREFEKRCYALLESSRDAIAYIHEGMHLYANPVYLEMFGFADKEELSGTTALDNISPDDHKKLKEFLKKYAKGKQEEPTLELQCLRPDGNKFDAVMEFSNASIDNEPCIQVIIRAQVSDKELEKKLKLLSKQDLLTGLFNRHYFIEELENAISKAINESHSSAVLYIEPDSFKLLKEQVGIAGADMVLSDIARIIQDQVDTDSICARFGDNTFSVLTFSDNTNEITSLAEVLRTAIEHHISEVEGKSVTYTVSIGICIVGETSTNAHDVLTKADVACEMVHKQGGNNVHMHNPLADLQASKDHDQYWCHMIDNAFENNKFNLVFQPIASLTGETDERYEVLLRMVDDEGKQILPGKFLPLAEQSDLILKIDRWVINEAIQLLTKRRAEGYNTILFIKLSGRTLTDQTLLPYISETLKAARLPGDALVFEISEPSAVTHLKLAKILSRGLAEMHCGFSVEDFGNGMNSFQLLKHLQVSYLKIDGSFIHNLSSSKENQTIVKSIVDMASSLNKPVIAEFVEDASSLTILWQSGVQYIQGNFLQEPVKDMDYDFIGESEEQSIF